MTKRNDIKSKIAKVLKIAKKKKNTFVRCGVRTHAHVREPELKSGALDHSANLTPINQYD